MFAKSRDPVSGSVLSVGATWRVRAAGRQAGRHSCCVSLGAHWPRRAAAPPARPPRTPGRAGISRLMAARSSAARELHA